MKRLRNIGLYYIGLTVFSVLLSLWGALMLFIPLLPFGAIGIICVVLYVFLKRSHKNQTSKKNKWIEKYSGKIDSGLYLLPFLFYAAVIWYADRPYRQTVVLPEGYEGVVAVQYDKPNGQPKKWTTGFLKIWPSRLIEVDSTGIAETQFTFHHNAIPLLGSEQTYYNRGGLAIYYENDLRHEIVPGFDATRPTTLETSVKGTPNIYMTGFNYYPLMIFVVTKPEKYYDYFMTEEEMIEDYKEKYKQEPTPYTFSDIRILNEKYN